MKTDRLILTLLTVLQMLIEHPSIRREMLGSDWSKVQHKEESFDYSADISPIILAAHCNQFEILQLLLLHGANIERPHQLSCPCKRCQAQVIMQPLTAVVSLQAVSGSGNNAASQVIMQPLTAVVSLRAVSGSGNNAATQVIMQLLTAVVFLQAMSGSGNNAATDSCRVPASDVRLR